jgi:hypothetical protein
MLNNVNLLGGLQYDDPYIIFVMSLLYFTGQSIFGWFFTTEAITNCGAAVS